MATLAPDVAPAHADCAFAGTVRAVALDPDALWAPVQTLHDAREDEVRRVIDEGRSFGGAFEDAGVG